eukprot:TRINITY_DN632_c0_g2_i1.p1 TRINITY_DN632_c0_g2~~TRINITY_DN632_c0_g2_i1.p1  ORF type:complete len:385 (-),score=111.40 TRINITY_DN632_c0_g2_i1:89-1198(-)
MARVLSSSGACGERPAYGVRHLAAAALGGAAVAVSLQLFLARRRRLEQQRSSPNEEASNGTAALPLLVPAEQLSPGAFDTSGADLRLLRKAEAVLRRRTGAVLVVLERLQDGHNFCAVLRTMEALGVQHVWVVNPPPMESKNSIKRRQAVELAETAKTTRVRKRAEERVATMWEADDKEDQHHLAFAKRAAQWLTVKEFASTADCVAALKEDGRAIWVTALEQSAQVLAPGAAWLDDPEALARPVALVMGAEEAGVSAAFKAEAERLVYLPLGGFAESLNVSVAAALSVQLVLQLLAASWPSDRLRLSEEEQRQLRADWYAQLARSDSDREKYRELIDAPPEPWEDLRRPEDQRVARTKASRRRKGEAV